jgi:hypothetical protein
MEIYRRVASVILGLLVVVLFSLKTLLARPRLDQGPIHAEM